MNILEIYEKYKIMPQLREHMLRVGAVAKIICDAVNSAAQEKVNTRNVVTACLLHDMGNIIKFDLTFFPEFVQPESLEYWQNVKNGFVNKYGNNEHVATDKIVEEIGVGKEILDLLSLTGFSKVLQVLESKSLEQKICNYADMRVGPFGILSIKDRTDDGIKRNAKKTSDTKNVQVDFQKIVEGLKTLEDQIFTKTSIIPSSISDQTTKMVIEELKGWEI